MTLSNISIRRPVVATVASVIVCLLGALSFRGLPVREYPDTDTPTISVSTVYPGASAEVVESRVTEPLEEQISSVDGIKVLKSSSREQVSQITVEFNLNRDVDEAANDVRDRVARARTALPEEVDEPQVSKVEADSNPFMWLALNSDRHSLLELSDFADRIVKQRVQTVPGVGNIRIGGEKKYAMRVWLDTDRLAAYQLTASDVERALREQNVDIPGGRVESLTREFTVRTEGDMNDPAQFEDLVLATRGEVQIKLKDVGRAEIGSEDYRTRSTYNGKPTVGVGVVRQSQSNLLEVAAAVKELIPIIQRDLPEGAILQLSFDSSQFVLRSVDEVYMTLIQAVGLVIFVIALFLRDWRATLIPLTAIPVSIIGSFAVMAALGFSVNILTLLALVLAVGLVVDDAIVMLENIYRRIEDGEPPIAASVRGARQVAFAIIATTLTLAAVFLPVAFQSGSTGRLFYEFGLTLAISVIVSGFVALTLTPMLCSRLLRQHPVIDGKKGGWFYRKSEPIFERINRLYARMLAAVLRAELLVAILAIGFMALAPVFYYRLQRELVPSEDRGTFLSLIRTPLGSTPDYTASYVADMDRLIRTVPEVSSNYTVTASGRSGPGVGSEGLMFTRLKAWEDRERKTQGIIAELAAKFRAQITGGLAFPVPVRPLGQRGTSEGVQFMIRGTDFDMLQQTAEKTVAVMRESGLFGQTRIEPLPNKPQVNVRIDRARAADLRVPISEVAATLETLFGGRRVTQFKRNSKQYYVVVQVEDADRINPSDLSRVYARSTDGHLVQLSNLVTTIEAVAPESYPHLDRLRSITVNGQLAAGITLGDAVEFLDRKAPEILPENYNHAWDGEAREYVESSGDTWMLFGLALLFTFLILAAQFESYLHPITIYTGVGLAISAGLLGLWSTRFWTTPMTDNLFSRFGLIMLIGLIAKNGILVVEFANQLQIQGKSAREAAFEAATLRFRPILMTAVSTVFGALPIAFASGAGSETRNPLGLVVVFGLTLSTFMTLFVVPVFYVTLDRLCLKFTGRSSAHGLKRAEEIAGPRGTEAQAASAPG
ncbi:MAG: efflux RND transporter permease subunit [Verrucomicrobiales bacterium]